ncbi:MAG: helix-turn-helix transcriptional regulator [Candidatus Muiribacteriota bacterium]
MKKDNFQQWFDNQFKELQKDSVFLKEGYVIKITEIICKKLREKKWTQKKLAQEMNVSEAYIAKMLNGNNNFTFSTLAKISSVLGIELKFDYVDLNKDEIPEIDLSYINNKEMKKILYLHKNNEKEFDKNKSFFNNDLICEEDI